MSELKTNKVSPATGTALTLGDSGDTFTVPSGATFAVSGTMNASSITAGTVATARLGSGTASSSTFLRGDQTYAAAGGGKILQVVEGTTISATYITTTTYADIGMYVTITPTLSTSKIYVSAVWAATQDGGSNDYSMAQLNREESGETDVAMGEHIVWYDTAGGDTGVTNVLQKLDAPTTTNALTYQVQAKVQSTSSGYRPKTVASIVAMEVGV